MSLIIYHNKRCSKSRQVLELLKSSGYPFDVIEYLHQPLTVKSLDQLCVKLACHPRDLVRKKERQFSLLDEDLAYADRKTWLKAIAEHPILLERPIVESDQRAVVGRPIENVIELLSTL